MKTFRVIIEQTLNEVSYNGLTNNFIGSNLESYDIEASDLRRAIIDVIKDKIDNNFEFDTTQINVVKNSIDFAMIATYINGDINAANADELHEWMNEGRLLVNNRVRVKVKEVIEKEVTLTDVCID